ncbi:MAG: hypothetical protein MUE46_03010 [Xanthomonadales bacterium]|nr:hypothetical protein [Xanthomonadales bacterium]
MDTVILLVIVIAVALVVHEIRSRWMQRAARAVGLSFGAGPHVDQRGPWRALAARVHDREPTTWGHTLRGSFDGATLALQEQELKPSISSNREWHTLVIWELPGAGLPIFRLDRSSDGRPWLREMVAPFVDPAVRALGGDPDPAPPSVPVPIAQDTDFSRRFAVVGPDADALIRHFDAGRRRAILTLDPRGPVASDSQRLIWLRPGRAGPTALPALLAETRALRRAFAAR